MNTFKRHKRSRDCSNIFIKIANIQKRSEFVWERSKNEDVNWGNSTLLLLSKYKENYAMHSNLVWTKKKCFNWNEKAGNKKKFSKAEPSPHSPNSIIWTQKKLGFIQTLFTFVSWVTMLIEKFSNKVSRELP